MKFILIVMSFLFIQNSALLLTSYPKTKFPKIKIKKIHNLQTSKYFKIKKSRSAILYQKLYNVFKDHADYTYSMSSFPLSYSFNNYNKTKIF